MPFVITDACIDVKDKDCLAACPVDCIYEGGRTLYIHPEECIDCGICEPECPAAAIRPDTEAGLHAWLDLNRHYASAWPNIRKKKAPPDNADVMNGAAAKLAIFSKNPGAGG